MNRISDEISVDYGMNHYQLIVSPMIVLSCDK